MEWMNENSGLFAFLALILIAVMTLVIIAQNRGLKRKIVAQRLNFLGLYSTDADTQETSAKLVVGNKSMIDFSFREIGVYSGKVAVNLTDVYRKKMGYSADVRLSVEQKNAVEICLNKQEIKQYLLGDGKKAEALSLYVVDASGKIYSNKIPAVRKLLKEMLSEGKKA